MAEDEGVLITREFAQALHDLLTRSGQSLSSSSQLLRRQAPPAQAIVSLEMIDNLVPGDGEAARAWPLNWDEETEEFVRGDDEVEVWCNAGFRGAALGRTATLDEGDIVEAYFMRGRYYAIAGRTTVLVKTDASHAKTAVGTCSVYAGDTQGSEADTFKNIQAWNRFAALSSGKWAMAVWVGSGWDLISGECS